MKRWGIAVALIALIATPVMAADMPVKVPPSPAPMAASWTGFYAGFNAGYGWQDPTNTISGDATNGAGSLLLNEVFNVVTIPLAFEDHAYPLGSRISGALGGFHLGYNWQTAPKWLVGIEADFDWSGLKAGSNVASALTGFQLTSNQQLDWFGTLRGRLGYLVTDRLVAFATGGLAYGETKAAANVANISAIGISVQPPPFVTSLTCSGFTTCLAASQSRISVGWAAGGGAEYAVSTNIKLRVEYLRVDLGAERLTLVAQPPTTGNGFVQAKFSNAYNVVRVGGSYKF